MRRGYGASLAPEKRESRPCGDRRLPAIPSLVGLDLSNSTELLEAQRFAEAVVGAVYAWRHRELRRREGVRK